MFKPEDIINSLVIDVREKSEWDFWNCKHATHVPLGSLQNWLMSNNPDKEQKIFVFCRSGNRSEMAKNFMQSMGFKNVINLGGLNQMTEIAMSINAREDFEGKK